MQILKVHTFPQSWATVDLQASFSVWLVFIFQPFFLLEITATESNQSDWSPDTETLLTSWNGFLFLGMELKKKTSEDNETFLSFLSVNSSLCILLAENHQPCEHCHHWSDWNVRKVCGGTSRCLAASLGQSIGSRQFPERPERKTHVSDDTGFICINLIFIETWESKTGSAGQGIVWPTDSCCKTLTNCFIHKVFINRFLEQ